MPPIGFKKLIADALPGTMKQLVEKSGCAESTIRRWLERMRLAGECHITRWERTGGQITPHYVSGAGKDAVCNLKSKTSAQYCKEHRKRLRKTGDLDFYYARIRAQRKAIAAKTKPQSWLSSLGLP